jgi:ferrous iron transport protein A
MNNFCDAPGVAPVYNANHSHSNFDLMAMRLSNLRKGVAAVVEQVHEAHASDPIARRLQDLGFVPGEPLHIVAHGPWGDDPLLVQIGSTRFALRRSEASRVSVREARTS